MVMYPILKLSKKVRNKAIFIINLIKNNLNLLLSGYYILKVFQITILNIKQKRQEHYFNH